MVATIFTPTKRAEFLDCLAETCNVTEAARRVGISRMRAYQVREAEPDFAKLWDAALQEGIDMLEREAQRRAFEGVDEPVYYQGSACGHVRRYSDTLTIFLLKAHRPERFRENTKIEMSGSLNLNEMSDEDIRAELAALAATVSLQKPEPESQADDDCSDLY